MKKTSSFLFIVILLLCLSACAVRIPKMTMLEQKANKEILLFEERETELVYDMSIKFFKKYNSGILVVKRDSSNWEQYRTVFLAKAGMKLFDIEFAKDRIQINSVIPPLKKKVILEILENDFRMLFDPISKKRISLTEKETNTKVIQTEKAKTYYHYYLNQEEQIIKIQKGKRRRAFVQMNCQYEDARSPNRIEINHKKIPFKISLDQIIH